MSKLIVKATSGNTVNLRASPSSEGKILKKVPVGSKVTLIEKTSSSWYKVTYESATGYMMSKYLTDSSSTITKAQIQEIYDSLSSALTTIEKILK